MLYACTLPGCTQKFVDPRNLPKHENVCQRRHPHLRAIMKSRTDLKQMTDEEKEAYDQSVEETRRRYPSVNAEPVVFNVKCTICQETMPRTELSKHHAQFHSVKDQDFPCLHCSKSFKSKQGRDYHLKSAHIAYEDMPYKCPFDGCQFRAAGASNLKKHVAVCQERGDDRVYVRPRKLQKPESKSDPEFKTPPVLAPVKAKVSAPSTSATLTVQVAAQPITYMSIVPERDSSVPVHVFVSKYSQSYHNDDCRRMGAHADSLIKVKLDEALSRRLQPCRFCRTKIFQREFDANPTLPILQETQQYWLNIRTRVYHQVEQCASSLSPDEVQLLTTPPSRSLQPCSKCVLSQRSYSVEEAKARKAARERERRQNMSVEQKEKELNRKRNARKAGLARE